MTGGESSPFKDETGLDSARRFSGTEKKAIVLHLKDDLPATREDTGTRTGFYANGGEDDFEPIDSNPYPCQSDSHKSGPNDLKGRDTVTGSHKAAAGDFSCY